MESFRIIAENGSPKIFLRNRPEFCSASARAKERRQKEIKLIKMACSFLVKNGNRRLRLFVSYETEKNIEERLREGFEGKLESG